MEREASLKTQSCKAMEMELKLLRSEREQFVEMGVRLEIQTKELGMIMRDQKENVNNKSKVSPKDKKGSNGPSSV